MTQDEQLSIIYQVLIEIRDNLKAGLTISKQFTIEAKGNEPFQIHSMDQLENQAKIAEPPYDWWQLANGQFAKVYRTNLTGEIYDSEGNLKGPSQWYALSLKSWNDKKEWDLDKRKSGEAKGWPEWTK